jgi:hypothetical protein
MWETSSTEEQPKGNGLLPEEDIGHPIKLPLLNISHKDIILGRGELALSHAGCGELALRHPGSRWIFIAVSHPR